MLKLFKIVTLLTIFSFNIALAQNVAINSEDARIWCENNGKALLQTLSLSSHTEKQAKLDEMMDKHVNLDYISKFVMGRYYKRMNNAQKNRYTQVFRRYILSIYKQFNLKINEDDISFKVDKIIEKNNHTIASILIDITNLTKSTEKQVIPVEFKLIRGAKNRIQTADLVISNISLVVEYRKRFNKMILNEEGDIDWFLDKLEDITRANEENFGRKNLRNLQI